MNRLLRSWLVLLVLLVEQAWALKDPTQPAYYSATGSSYVESLKSNYQLNSILLRKTQRVAVINGEQVREGEHIGEAEVREISQSGVKLAVQGVVFSISLTGTGIKRK